MWCFGKFLFFFFFKQKTAYEMRISDWSSDVCSSDLRPIGRSGHRLYLLQSRQLRPRCQVADRGRLCIGDRKAGGPIPLVDSCRAGRCVQQVSITEEAILAWVLLAIAGLLAVVCAFVMQPSYVFTKPTPTVITIVTMIACFCLLSLLFKSLLLGTLS